MLTYSSTLEVPVRPKRLRFGLLSPEEVRKMAVVRVQERVVGKLVAEETAEVATAEGGMEMVSDLYAMSIYVHTLQNVPTFDDALRSGI